MTTPRDELQPLSRRFYARDVATVARGLLGCLLVRAVGGDVLAGRIVETEAYLAEGDPASHSHRGPTPRNASMFGPPGHAYVYPIHAKHCFNVVTEARGVGSAVLIRAVEPLAGVDAMRARRGNAKDRDLTRGPARLCAAFAIDRSIDGHDLTLGQTLWIARGDEAGRAEDIVATPRIGVSQAQDLALRFIIRDSRFVSGTRRQNGG